MLVDLVVSRHRGAIWFICKELNLKQTPTGLVRADGQPIPLLSRAEPEDVRGKVVVGNLPFHLAAICKTVLVVEFTDGTPRGEISPTDMITHGAVITPYVIHQLGQK